MEDLPYHKRRKYLNVDKCACWCPDEYKSRIPLTIFSHFLHKIMFMITYKHLDITLLYLNIIRRNSRCAFQNHDSLPMAGNDDIESSMSRLQRAIGYQFEQKNILKLALTAAGAEETNHDGNRKLAQLGEALIESVLVDKAYSEGSSRSNP